MMVGKPTIITGSQLESLEDDEQGFWRQLVSRVWSKAEETSKAKANPAPSTAVSPARRAAERLLEPSKPTGSGEDWRALVAARLNGDARPEAKPREGVEGHINGTNGTGGSPAVSLIDGKAEAKPPTKNGHCNGTVIDLLEDEEEEEEEEAEAEAVAEAEAQVDQAVDMPVESAGAAKEEVIQIEEEEKEERGTPAAMQVEEQPAQVQEIAQKARAPRFAPKVAPPKKQAPPFAPKVPPPKKAAPVLAPTMAPVQTQDPPPRPSKHYLVDNGSLQAKTQGLGYRKSKCDTDIDWASTAAWGSTVVGFDEGDGWVRVDDKYLPMQVNGKRVLIPKLALARTTSGTFFAPFAASAASATKPAGVFIPRSNSNGEQPAPGLQLRRQGSLNGPPAGLFLPRSGGPAGLKRQGSELAGQPLEKKLSSEGPRADVDTEGRPYDLNHVIVNFANVGATYACKVLGRDKARGDRLFDWEGVRRCVRHLTEELGLEVIGVIMENFWAPDNSQNYKRGIPEDIRAMCENCEETPKLIGKNHKSCDDEMTIKCAYRRNCRFLDNDNYRDWKREMRNDRCRAWLSECQELLQMRYFFDSQLGTFDTLDGKIADVPSAPG